MQALVRRRRSQSSLAVRQRARVQMAEGVLQKHGGLAQMEALDVIAQQYSAYRAISAYKRTLYAAVVAAVDSHWRVARGMGAGCLLYTSPSPRDS